MYALYNTYLLGNIYISQANIFFKNIFVNIVTIILYCMKILQFLALSHFRFASQYICFDDHLESTICLGFYHYCFRMLRVNNCNPRKFSVIQPITPFFTISLYIFTILSFYHSLLLNFECIFLQEALISILTVLDYVRSCRLKNKINLIKYALIKYYKKFTLQMQVIVGPGVCLTCR